MLNYDKQLNESHGINASLVGFANSMNIRNQVQSDKNAHLALQVRYNFNRKLLVDMSAAYVNSVKLPKGNRTKLSPSFGVAYILSEESFLKNSNLISYLKVKGSAGIINSDNGIWDYFLYDEVWSQGGGGFSWNDGSSNQRTRIAQGANYGLTFERRKDINIGLEAILFDNLWLELNAFQSEIDNQVTRLNNQYPSFYSDFMPFGNFNMDRYQGVELGMNYYKSFGKLMTDLGLRMMYTNSERVKVDENYQDGYQYRTGKPVDAIWGLQDLGFYQSADFDENGNLNEELPQPAFGKVRPGDIRYADQNGDLVINDQDQQYIGQWRDPWLLSANVKLQYGPLSFFMLGDGQFGSEQMLNNNYYWVDGNDKYSEVVWGRWTEDNADNATYPRLSSQDNNNNFRSSTFWLINNSFFRLRRVQLSYELPTDLVNSIFMKHLNVFVSGANLFELAENKEERQLQIGGNPMFRYYTVGLRAKF